MNEIINDVAVKVRDGEGLTNQEARNLLEAYAALDIVIQAQGNLATLVLQGIPELVFAVGGAVTERCGRTEEKLRRSVHKICETHVSKYYQMIAEIVEGSSKNHTDVSVPDSGDSAEDETTNEG